MSASFSKKRIAVLGAGKMGGILIKALVDKHQISPERVRATVAHEARAEELSKKLGVTVTTDNVSAVDGADIILVCVKPQVVQEVMEQISEKVTAKQLVISVAASVHTSQIESALGAGMPVVRAMPNTPCVLGQGMTALCKGQYAAAEHVDAACALFNVVGRTVVVDEKHMDAVFRPAAQPTFTSFWNRSLRRG
jgi:pyrroline-5-carboxylate reductase